MKDINIKLLISGNVDSGKSTTISCLTNNILDDGRGKARTLILKAKHEKETGRTTNITFNNLIYQDNENRKIFTFIDLPGHEKYYKTTLTGMTGSGADYGVIIISANTGFSTMTKEHMGILYYMKIPFMIIITKIDICPDNILKETINNIKFLFKKTLPDKKFYFINKKEDIGIFDSFKVSNTIVPIFTISNKTGTGVDLMKYFIFNLNKKFLKNETNSAIFYIENTYRTAGFNHILSGYLKSGSIKINQLLFIGPLNGKFIKVKVKSIHNNNKESIEELTDSGCIAISFLNKKETISRSMMKKGMVLISDMSDNISFKFKAKIKILHHASTITLGYTPVIHCNNIRQAAKLLIEKDKILRTGSSEIVEFQFLFRPEFLEIGAQFFFRDGKTKGHGMIVQVP